MRDFGKLKIYLKHWKTIFFWIFSSDSPRIRRQPRRRCCSGARTCSSDDQQNRGFLQVKLHELFDFPCFYDGLFLINFIHHWFSENFYLNFWLFSIGSYYLLSLVTYLLSLIKCSQMPPLIAPPTFLERIVFHLKSDDEFRLVVDAFTASFTLVSIVSCLTDSYFFGASSALPTLLAAFLFARRRPYINKSVLMPAAFLGSVSFFFNFFKIQIIFLWKKFFKK